MLTTLLYSNVFAYNSYDGTHEVSSYTRNDGTYVEEHRAGNPGSGIHCHDNVCE